MNVEIGTEAPIFLFFSNFRHFVFAVFIDLVFAKTSPKRSFQIIENERFKLVFAKTGTINSGILHGYPLLSDKIQILITETNSQENKLDGIK